MAIPMSLPGLQVECERETLFAVNVSTSMAGIETRTRWHSTPRYRYRISIIGRQEAAGELSALAAAVTDVSGEWATFSLVDPYDGVTRTCRLEGTPKFSQFRVKGWWKVDFGAITVV